MTTRAFSSQSKRVIPVRLTRELLDQIDQYVVKLNRQCTGLNVKRSDAIRILLHKGLEVASASDRH